MLSLEVKLFLALCYHLVVVFLDRFLLFFRASANFTRERFFGNLMIEWFPFVDKIGCAVVFAHSRIFPINLIMHSILLPLFGLRKCYFFILVFNNNLILTLCRTP